MKRLKLRVKGSFAMLGLLLAVSAWLVPHCYGSSKLPDGVSIQQRMQKMIDFLDSPSYAELVSWDEHVVMVYRLTQGREPSPLEFFLLRRFREEIGMRRSTVLSVALRGEAPYLTWAHCRAFLNRVKVSDFQVDPEVRGIARRLAAVPRSEILEMLKPMAENAQIDRFRRRLQVEPPLLDAKSDYKPYNTYFGYLHAHSELSDGEGDPVEAYTYAYGVGGLDFFALTDHGELLDPWPWANEWEELVNAAEALYQPGTYVTLWGFEWSNPILGHINVLNTPDYTSSISDFLITDLYDWLSDRPEGFGRFNHPGDYDDLFTEFLHMELYPEAVPQMVGIETWNGNDSFDQYYYDGGWVSEYSYWDEGNLLGWYLGALGGQDNHRRGWGLLNDFRIAVLAEELTREHIVAAYLNRRFYATEDKDLYLDLRCRGYPMGSRFHYYPMGSQLSSGGPRGFRVEAWDGSGDTFKEVRLYRNGKLLETKIVSGNSIWVLFWDLFRIGSDYYYVIVQQNDDNDGNGRNDEAISSPIWID
jgi:hypothetical protein